MPILYRDIETRSTLDLPEVGTARYAADPSTGVWCVCFAIDDGPVQTWIPGQPIPEEFTIAARDPDWLIVAHNDGFERAIEERILAPRYGWPIVPIERHRCTMAMALAAALPAALNKVAEVLELSTRKDDQGARLMRQMAQPRKPRADEDPAGIYWHDDPEKLDRLYTYCQNDVEVERELFRRLPPLADSEQALWALDATINSRGFHTDGPLLEAASRIAATAGQAAHDELTRITDGALTSTDQVTALQTWLGEHGCEVKDVRKPTLKHALTRKALDPVARRVIELRLGAAHAAAAKIDTLLAWRDTDGRVRGTLRYHGAGTGRWTGHGPQPQNFKRDGDDIDAKREAIATGDLAHVQERYPQPLEIVGDIARAMICAAPEHRFLISDFSGIESRVLAWVSGQQSKLDQWAKFDRTGDPKDEPYYLLGRQCGQPEESARKIGKIADLAFGYCGGAGAWDRLAPEDDTTTDADKRRYQQTWRSAHPQIRQFWSGIDRAAITAIRKQSFFTYKQFTLAFDGTFLRIVLPSGRALSYPFPRLEKGKFGHPMVMFKDNAAGKWVDCRYGQGAYGGLWTENIVQAVSRDLLAAAMMRLESAGYAVTLHVHDEVVAEAPIGIGSVEEFQRLITTLPDWADGLPIAAKVRNGARFAKSTSTKNTGESRGPTSPSQPDAAPIPDEDDEKGNFTDDATPNGRDALDEMFAAAYHAQSRASESGDEKNIGDDESTADSDGTSDHNQHAEDHDQEYPKGERRTGRRIAVYLYRDHLGGNHTRVEKWRSSTATRAQYPQFFWSGGRWVSQKPKGWTKIPYRLPEMLAALAKDSATDIYNPEGEKDCETLAALGLMATTNSEGATPLKAKIGKWTPELSRWFYGVRRLFILADNDEVGRAFANEKARARAGIVPDIRIVTFPDVPEGEDVSWWLEHNHTKDELIARCGATERWQSGGILESVRADQVPLRAIHWLWRNRFALGKIGIIAGLPDVGKGQILCYIAARITRGLEWPNGEGRSPQGNVIMLSAEENPSDSLGPRLEAAGADLSRIHFVKMVCDYDIKTGQQHKRMFSLVSDLEKLRHKLTEIGNIIGILIDPISAYLGIGEIDSYRDTDVRAALGPLKDLTEEIQAATIGIMHFNKKIDITNALLRVSNSMAFVGLPRHVYGVVTDTENMRRLFVRAKNNDAAESDNQTLAYHFEVHDVGKDDDSGESIKASSIVWEPGYVDVTAAEAMQAASENKSPSARNTAKQFLLDLLANDREVPVNEIKEAAEGHGIAWRTINRAKEDLAKNDDLTIIVDKDRTKPDGKWFWKLA